MELFDLPLLRRSLVEVTIDEQQTGFLDLATGEVIRIPRSALEAAERGTPRGLKEENREFYDLAVQVRGDVERYAPFPDLENELFDWMAGFADFKSSDAQFERYRKALGRGPADFLELLEEEGPERLEAWETYINRRLDREIQLWLDVLGADVDLQAVASRPTPPDAETSDEPAEEEK